MSKEIRPALTPEEWKDRYVSRGQNGLKIETMTESGYLALYLDEHRDQRDRFEVEAEDCHALAALALHCQPFGFSKEDVDLLRHAAADQAAHAD